MNFRCRLGLHDFRWPLHSAFDDWLSTGQVFRIECYRGCGARTVLRCSRDYHYIDRHPEVRALAETPGGEK